MWRGVNSFSVPALAHTEFLTDFTGLLIGILILRGTFNFNRVMICNVVSFQTKGKLRALAGEALKLYCAIQFVHNHFANVKT